MQLLIKINITQNGKHRTTVTAERGTNLLKLFQKEGIEIESSCGGAKICGKCKIRIIKPFAMKERIFESEGKALLPDEIKRGIRLACCVEVSEDMEIEIPERNLSASQGQIVTHGANFISYNPLVVNKEIVLDKPSINDQKSDVERIEEAVQPARFSFNSALVKMIPDILRNNDFTVNVQIFGEEIVSVTGEEEQPLYGLAVDIGTTTVVGYLLNLTAQREEGMYAVMNPQRIYGADVISRIDYTLKEADGLATLSTSIKQAINGMIEYFEAGCGISGSDIYHVVIAGNTVMTHLLTGISVKRIAYSPFTPVVTRRYDMDAYSLGLNMFSSGKVTVLPGVAGYIGSDTVGCLLSSGMYENEKVCLMIDIGTNGEIVLGNKDGMTACSTAAGPAFEGAHLFNGMCALPGAISKAVFENGKIVCSTIGNVPAKGICGSGIVDCIAELKRNGIIDMGGRIYSKDIIAEHTGREFPQGVYEINGQKALMIVEKGQNAEKNVFITQKDIREVQMAKAAIAAGIEILLLNAGLSFTQIDSIFLAGGFGNYINIANAIEIGILPDEARDKIVSIGNGAGTGAKMALMSKEMLDKAEEISRMINYIELSANKEFQGIFMKKLRIG